MSLCKHFILSPSSMHYWAALLSVNPLRVHELEATHKPIKGAKKSTAKQDEEYRVWYVGITRTMKNLYLVRSPNKSKEFKI